jgi:putative addiction module component (TIGR02574 family)
LAYNALMSNRAQELLREALSLPPDERADVAAELLASLDEPMENPAEVEAAWAAEIERRARRVQSGESAGEPWEDVRDRIVRRLMK